MAKKSVKNTSADGTQPAKKPVAATASTARQALVATGVMLAFVLAATLFAGVGPNAGRTMVALMVALVILQGVRNVNPFVQWAANHPLTPGDSTFTVKGTS